MKDKNIVIIGGNSGIGKAVAEDLKDKGANLFMYSKSGENTRQLDVVEPFKDIQGLPDEVHGLVYCPGSINLKPFHRFEVEDFRTDLEVNYLGAIKVLQAAMKSLKKSGNASVVLFSTVAVQTGMGFHSSIAGAKGAVEGLVRSLAAEWAPAHIRVNAVAPSLTDTRLAHQLLSSEEKKQASDKRHPLGRYGKPEDIAAAVSYLLSDQSSWVTGQVMHVDGGLSVIKGM
jgi:NAD(P)-dependent dehydrogenase (short-subunit alcohol dehydrogenase family)